MYRLPKKNLLVFRNHGGDVGQHKISYIWKRNQSKSCGGNHIEGCGGGHNSQDQTEESEVVVLQV
jgi:hypothetical protein